MAMKEFPKEICYTGNDWCVYIAMLDSGQVVLAFLSVCILCLMFTSVYRLPVKHSLI